MLFNQCLSLAASIWFIEGTLTGLLHTPLARACLFAAAHFSTLSECYMILVGNTFPETRFAQLHLTH